MITLDGLQIMEEWATKFVAVSLAQPTDVNSNFRRQQRPKFQRLLPEQDFKSDQSQLPTDFYQWQVYRIQFNYACG